MRDGSTHGIERDQRWNAPDDVAGQRLPQHRAAKLRIAEVVHRRERERHGECKPANREFPAQPPEKGPTRKRAEDGDGLIVRLYESQRKRGPIQIRFGRAVEAAWTTNLLEENESALQLDQDSIQLNLRPYQIVTLRVRLQ